MSEIDEVLRKKYESRKESSRYSLMIWAIAASLSAFFIFFGIFEFLLDTEQCTEYVRYIQGDSKSQLYCPTVYDEEGLPVSGVFPVFGLAFKAREDTDGILPDAIGLTINDWIVLGLIVLIGIPSVFIYQREARRLTRIDDNLPYLLREIADSQRIGMHLPRAISEAAKRNYGPLTPELRKLAAKVSWGISFRDAMTSFRDSVDTSLAKQATILILEAEKSGGELEEIFDSATHHIQEQLDIKREREASIKPYIYIVYVAYVIFCVVIFVLFSTFFNQFADQAIVVNDVETIVVPIHAFRIAFIYVLMSQAFFSGLTAGKMGGGSIKNGTFHAFVLMVIGFLFYKFTIA